jgi:Mannosylglycerate hydrolase MGH1-like glycoside hydrolase domain
MRIIGLATIVVSLIFAGCVYRPGSCGSYDQPPSTAIAKGISVFRARIGDAEWQKLQARLAQVNWDIATNGILMYSNLPAPLLTGYKYHQFYDWDDYFENLYMSYNGIPDYCFNNFKAFMSFEQPDGFIRRSFGPKNFGATQQFKPFLAQIAILGSKQRGNDFEWLRGAYYDGLRKYIDRWFAYDGDSNGLPVWESSDASGMDNEIRRAGRRGSYSCEGTDLACFLYRELQALAYIAGKLGKPDDEKAYSARADALAKRVNTILWDEKEGFYFDRNEKTGRQIHVLAASGFLPLWVGIASREQARRMVEEHLLNTNEFWLKYPIATYAATEPDFYEGRKHTECNWQGPAWVPINYMVMHGLLRYGYTNAARELAYRTFRMALDENPATREYYDSDTGKGNGMDPFFGWSTLAYVMPLEVETGYDPMALHGEIKPILAQDLKAPWPAQ